MSFLQRLLGGAKPPGSGTPTVGVGGEDQPRDILDEPLLAFENGEAWTVRDACEGTQIFGGTGSGKTSGSGETIARNMLELKFGGLVCTAKPDEADLWQRLARETGREGSLVFVRPGENGEAPVWRFNFLDYERNRTSAGGGRTENIVNLLTTVTEIAEGKQGQEGGDPFWKRAMQELVRNAVDALALAGQPITLDNIARLIATAPQDAAQVHSEDWQNSSYLFTVLSQADAKATSDRQQRDLELTGRYWMQAYPQLNDRTRTSIVATFSGVADILLRGDAYELLGTDTTITPEATFTHGAIIVLDLPVQSYRQAGKIVQGIWKYLFQQALMQRHAGQYPRPVFLWCDESQNFVSPFDYQFQAVARSARACTVYLSQNISNYHAVMGGNAKANADALLGNFQTKIFHANADAETNRYASELIGKHWTTRGNIGTSSGKPGDATFSAGASESLEYKIEPSTFTTLAKGGPTFGYLVQGMIFQGGRQWTATNDTYREVKFRQSGH